MKTFILDYREIYKGNNLEYLFTIQNNNQFLPGELYDKLDEIESAHIKRTSKIRRIRRALRRYGYELQVKNSGYGMKKNG